MTADAGAQTAPPLPFQPQPPILPGRAHPGCRACVLIPARDEERSLAACLEALGKQTDTHGKPLPATSFEIILLLNNCTDRSAEIGEAWRRAHRETALHIIELELPDGEAHAGTARRLLMDTAWHRLSGHGGPEIHALLCTDADSTVAPDWIATNLRALQHGADAVGGVISLHAAELDALPSHVRRSYLRDRRYAHLVAQLEDMLDPQPGDPWPRHLDHFGSSLACTHRAYALAGGMPAAAVLEDEAFVDRLRRASLRLRHDPAVRVSTSARMDGRAVKGLAGQLRLWSELVSEEAHRVQSAAFLEHRFRTLHRLRQVFESGDLARLRGLSPEWIARLGNALHTAPSIPAFLAEVNSDALIRETFEGRREEPIADAIAALKQANAAARKAGGAHRLVSVATYGFMLPQSSTDLPVPISANRMKATGGH